jgi:hypothetical protein
MAPTALAENVSVGGRVMTPQGFAVRGALVTIRDSSNNVIRTTTTSMFGHYRLEGIAAGATYTISVKSARYTFTPRTMPINTSLTDVDFTAVP